MLIEKSIEHELVGVDMAAREHRGEAYRGMNPYGRVPALIEDGFILYESNAILTYLEATRPEPALVPPDARGRARVDMHLRLCDQELARHTSTIIFPKRFLPRERWNEPAMAQARGEIERHLAIIEREIADRLWMVGDRYSLVEVSYTPFVQFLSLMDIEPGPNVARWVTRMLDRPSARSTAPAH